MGKCSRDKPPKIPLFPRKWDHAYIRPHFYVEWGGGGALIGNASIAKIIKGMFSSCLEGAPSRCNRETKWELMHNYFQVVIKLARWKLVHSCTLFLPTRPKLYVLFQCYCFRGTWDQNILTSKKMRLIRLILSWLCSFHSLTSPPPPPPIHVSRKIDRNFTPYLGIFQIQWNLVIKRSDITKTFFQLFIFLCFLPWYNEKPDIHVTR